MATLRNLAIGILKTAGHTSIAVACGTTPGTPPGPWKPSDSTRHDDKSPAWLAHLSLTGLEPPAWRELVARYAAYLDAHPATAMPGSCTGLPAFAA